MRRIYLGFDGAAAILLLGLAACQPDATTRAVLTAPPVVAAINNPALDAGEKTCAVLDWGIPLADSRAATWKPWQQQALAVARQVAAAGCRLDDANWKIRATAAGVELANALWDLRR